VEEASPAIVWGDWGTFMEELRRMTFNKLSKKKHGQETRLRKKLDRTRKKKVVDDTGKKKWERGRETEQRELETQKVKLVDMGGTGPRVAPYERLPW